MASVVVIAALTLFPSHTTTDTAPFGCILCGDRGLADFILNVVLFAPLGAALVYAGVRPRWAMAASALFSASIELAQVWIPGRDSSLGDVLSNSLGGILGIALSLHWRAWLQPPPRARLALAASWTAVVALAAWATVLLFQPAYPLSTYYGQWTPELGNLSWYRGQVLAATIGAVPVSDGRATDSRLLRSELQDGAPIVVRATAGPPTPDLASLFSIADNRERGILLVGPDRADLVYLYRTRAEALRLDSPELRARGLLRGIRPNDSLRVVVSRRGHDICLSANGRNACGLSPGPTMGWALLVSTMVASERSPKWLVVVLDAAWLVLLALPIGYWSPGKGAAALLGAALLAAVAGAAVYAGSVVPPQAAYGALGLALGVVASRYFRRGPPAEPPA